MRQFQQFEENAATFPIHPQAYSVQLITTEEALRRLSADWITLETSCGNPNVFATWGWIWSWWRTFGKQECRSRGTRLFILAVYRDKELCGVFPFVLRYTVMAKRLIRKVEFVDLEFADYMDPLIQEDPVEQFQAVFAYLQQHASCWDLLMLRRMRTENGLPVAVNMALSNGDLQYRSRPDEPYCYLRLKSDGSTPYLSASMEASFRRKWKRLRGLTGNLQIRFIDGSDEVGVALLDKLIRVETRKVRAGGPAAPLLGAYRQFFLDVFENLSESVSVALMELDHQCIAYEMGFIVEKKLWSYTRAFDPDYARYSPGILLMSAVLEHARDRGYTQYDLLRGHEPFKQRLTKQLHRPVRFDIWNAGWRSRMASLLYFDVRGTLYRWRSRISGSAPHADL